MPSNTSYLRDAMDEAKKLGSSNINPAYYNTNPWFIAEGYKYNGVSGKSNAPSINKGSTLNNCVGWVIGRLGEKTGNQVRLGAGNAKAKYDNAISFKYARGDGEPPSGSFAVYGPTPQNGGYGHVVYVESATIDHGQKMYYISESGYDSGGGYAPRVKYLSYQGLITLYGAPWIGWVNPSSSYSGNYKSSAASDSFSGGGRNLNTQETNEATIPSISYQVTTTTREVEVTRDTLHTVDENVLLDRTSITNLLSTSTLVETPFVIAKIGDYTLGTFTKKGSVSRNNSLNVTYPNLMKGITITKLNNTINQYVLNLEYQIQAGDDPNLVDKILSTVSQDRKIVLSYGDWSSPAFIYRDEEAIITKVTSRVDFAAARINYVINCTSSALQLSGGTHDFPATKARPSTIIRSWLFNNSYGILDIFKGMRNKAPWSDLIPSDDKEVMIEAKNDLDPLSYLNYLVTCMSANTNTDDGPLKDSSYFLTVYDDMYREDATGGSYFKIVKVNSQGKTLASADTYELDVGYPGPTAVMDFSLNNDSSWSILYNYSDKINDNDNYVYNIDNNGNVVTEFSPPISNNFQYNRTTESDKTWWTNMTQFPVAAEITIKGLLRPAILMTYLRINAFFYGQRHVSSGLYIITKQVDTIDGSGYRTRLSLTRIAGDEDYFVKETHTETVTIKQKRFIGGSGFDDALQQYGDKESATMNAIMGTSPGNYGAINNFN